MKVIKQYKTFNNETGEIRIDCKIISDKEGNRVIQNGEIILDCYKIKDAKDYYDKLKQMDEYIASKLKWYEVYEIL